MAIIGWAELVAGFDLAALADKFRHNARSISFSSKYIKSMANSFPPVVNFWSVKTTIRREMGSKGWVGRFLL